MGASLLAMRPSQSTLISPEPPLSRASSLPQGYRLTELQGGQLPQTGKYAVRLAQVLKKA
ncbi:hypothetical protein EMIT0196MI5_250011 [Pseudomonas sp. IT-196MI5]